MDLNRIPGPVYWAPALDVKAWKAFVSTKLELSESRQKLVHKWLKKWVRSGEGQDEEDGIFKPASRPDVYLAILILACPHLRMLHTSGTPTEQLWPTMTLSLALYSNGSEYATTGEPVAQGFSNIEKVTLSSEDSFLENIGHILRWPSIKKFEVDGVSAGNNLYPSIGPAFQSTLTELRITNAIISVDDISILFKPCTQLRSLSMSWNEVCDVYREEDWRKLATALTACNPLLEEIHLDIAHEVDVRERFGGTVPNNFLELDEAEQAEYLVANNRGLGSLQGFPHLRKLSAPYIALFGVFDNAEKRDRDWTLTELLPTSLEELNIFCEYLNFKETEMALLNAPGTSGLRDITIWNCTRDRWISRMHGEGRSG